MSVDSCVCSKGTNRYLEGVPVLLITLADICVVKERVNIKSHTTVCFE